MNSIEVLNLSKRYGKVEALRNVSFAVETAEIFGYLGPNGAGKTTTLRVILGLVRASGGEVRLFGDSNGRAAGRNAIGYLPGELKLYGDMTGQTLLDYFAAFHPQRPSVLRDKLLEAFGVDASILSRKIKHLSHGTKQKIGLIVAMQHDPDLVLLDEPTNGLDPLVQQAFLEIVRDFVRRGRAVLFSSHVLSEVESVCGRVAIVRSMVENQLPGGLSNRGILAFGWNHPVAIALGTAVAIMLASRAVAGEIESGAIEILLSQPLSRVSYLGIHVGFATSSLILLSALGAVGTVVGQRSFDLQMFESPLLIKVALNYFVLQAAWHFQRRDIP